MPLLGGLFSRKQKSVTRLNGDGPGADPDSTSSSPSASYILPDKFLPSTPNASSFQQSDESNDRPVNTVYSIPLGTPVSSSSKFRLPFGRKKSAGVSPSMLSKPASHPLGRASTSSTVLEDDTLSLRPPARSAMFQTYGDANNSLSTRSLPNEKSPPLPAKRPSIFAWTKPPPTSTLARSQLAETSSPSASAGSKPPLPSADSKDSFNLVSFRHVRPPSPTNVSNASLSTPIPRPRGASVNSESSQRISVGAFREAQAKRSVAGSPVSSFRSPSPGPPLPSQPSPFTADARGSPRPPRSTPHITRPRPRSSMIVTDTTESDASSSAEEESEDDMLSRKAAGRTAPGHKPGKSRAKSELGHGGPVQSASRIKSPAMSTRAPKSHLGHSGPPSRNSEPPFKFMDSPEQSPKPQSTTSQYVGGVRQRASISTSALTPSPAAKRASVTVPTTPATPHGSHTPVLVVTPQSAGKTPSISTDERTRLNTAFNRSMTNVSVAKPSKVQPDSDSDSEDDAPLAKLVPPGRPGSSMSSYSATGSKSGTSIHSRAPLKPLIDINELTSGKPPTLPRKNMDGFTTGPTLLAEAKASSRSPPSATSLRNEQQQGTPIVSTVPPVKFVSPPPSPPKEYQALPSKPAEDVPKRDFGAESKRDILAERLSKAVTRNLSPDGGDLRSSTTSPRTVTSPATEGRPPPTSTINSVVYPSVSKANLRDTSAEARPSPPDQDLAQLLGGAAKYIRRNSESTDSESSESESDSDPESTTVRTAKSDQQGMDKPKPIAPIPIKQRQPAPSFTVISRPPLPKRESSDDPLFTPEPRSRFPPSVPGARPRSSTLIPSPTPSFVVPKAAEPDMPSAPSGKKVGSTTTSKPTGQQPIRTEGFNPNTASVRPRSTTLMTGAPISTPQPKLFPAPEPPFLTARRNSPSSSTGDSSSGRAPLTPRDGSDLGLNDGKKWSGGVSGLGVKPHHKRRSVSFEEGVKDPDGSVLQLPGRPNAREGNRNNGDARPTIKEEDLEERRRERRRSEAKAAIELGKVINGPRPVLTDDEEDTPVNMNRGPAMNMMRQPGVSGMPMNPWMGNMQMPMQMPMQMQQPMLSPAQFMAPPPADPQFFAAHQQAMMIAKQAYQMAVAQQAMAAASDEWERGSAMGGYSGSVYGGGSVGPGSMIAPYGMMPMMPGWGGSQSVYLNSSQSVYGSQLGVSGNMMSSARSDFGGGVRTTGNWSSSRSSYGDSFGPSSDNYSRKTVQTPRRPGNGGRDSGYHSSATPPASSSQTKLGSTPRARTTSQPAPPSRGGAVGRNAPPPSSWRAGM